MKLELKNDHMALSLSMNDCCQNSTPTSKLDPSNPNNPFEEVGTVHNEALLHLQSKLGNLPIIIEDDLMLTGTIIEDDLIIQVAVDYLKAYPFKNPRIKDLFSEKSELIIDEIGQWDPRPGDTLLSPAFPARTVVATSDWMESMRNAKVPVDVLGYGLSAIERGHASPAQYIRAVKRMESIAMAADISEDDKTRVLAVASIARHSTAFWVNQNISAQSAAGPIGSDVKGAVGGAAASVVTGGATVLIGALLGAAVRSGAYLLTSKVTTKP